MPYTPRFSFSHMRKGVCLLVVSSHLSVFAAPAQEPLLTASAGPKPNVVLTLDDSGSMNWHMMPTEVGNTVRYVESQGPVIGTVVTYTRRTPSLANRTKCNNYWATNTLNPIAVPPNTAPPTTNNIRTDCYTSSSQNVYGPNVFTPETTLRDLYPRIHPSDHNGNGRNVSGVVDTNLEGYNGLANLFAARFRSSDINGNYYNPDTVYQPWPASARSISSSLVNDDGSIKDLRQVPLYPEGAPSSGTTTVNLVDDVSVTANWCAEGMTNTGTYALGTSGNDYVCPSTTRTFSPAVYFKKVSGDGTNISHFQRVNINSSTDIPDNATRAAQQKNFAIWFTYYRNRILTAKGAVSLAFDAQKDGKFRLGYGRINRGITLSYDRNGNIQASTSTVAIDGYNSKVMVQGVRSFDNTTTEKYRSAFMNWLRGLPASGGTPLRMAMQDVGEYFKTASPYRTDPTSSSSNELSCRRNYHILVTDGYWNDPDGSVSAANDDGAAGTQYTTPDGKFKYGYTAISPYTDSSSKTLADVAMQYWKSDLRTGLSNDLQLTDSAKASPNSPDNNPAFWQHMVNFTVGLGVSGSIDKNAALGSFSWPTPVADRNTAIDDLWHAAVNSRGKYLSARDPIAFSKSLSSILSSITSTGGTISGVAVSRSFLASGTLKFEPSFEPDKWSGELKAIELSSAGAETTNKWLASNVMPAYDKRNLWTGTTSGAAQFTKANLTDTTPLGHIRTGANNVGVATEITDDLVNYLRGDSSKESSDGFRPRKTVTLADNSVKTNVLGSMINSVPLFLKGTNFDNRFLPAKVNGVSTGSGTYGQFVTKKRQRAGLVVIGANDGMVHGFRATDGVEMFGYIPQAVRTGVSHTKSTSDNLFGMARLADPNYEHQFYMDGQLVEGDVSYCSGDSCTWKNIVVAAAGGGAKTLVALDLTTDFAKDSSTQPAFFGSSNRLWEFGPDDNDLGYVISSPEIGMLPSGEWAVVFGNGYDSKSGTATLFIVNAKTGSLIKKITVSSATGNGLGGVRLVRDLDNIVRHAYAGDLLGNVWKFDMTKQEVDFGGSPMFIAKQGDVVQPITATPNYTLHPTKGLMVVVPTGKLYDSNDVSQTGYQTIYGLWDKAPVGKASASGDAIPMSKLNSQVVQSASNSKVFKIVSDGTVTDSRGWKLRMLFADGERGIYTPQFIDNYTYVETVKPGQLSTESCSIAEGSGYGYLINTLTGAQPSSAIMDLNNDGKFDSSDEYGVFERSEKARGTVVDGSTGGDGGGVVDPSGNSKRTLPETNVPNRYWRQLFWIIR